MFWWQGSREITKGDISLGHDNCEMGFNWDMNSTWMGHELDKNETWKGHE